MENTAGTSTACRLNVDVATSPMSLAAARKAFRPTEEGPPACCACTTTLQEARAPLLNCAIHCLQLSFPAGSSEVAIAASVDEPLLSAKRPILRDSTFAFRKSVTDCRVTSTGLSVDVAE